MNTVNDIVVKDEEGFFILLRHDGNAHNNVVAKIKATDKTEAQNIFNNLNKTAIVNDSPKIKAKIVGVQNSVKGKLNYILEIRMTKSFFEEEITIVD